MAGQLNFPIVGKPALHSANPAKRFPSIRLGEARRTRGTQPMIVTAAWVPLSQMLPLDLSLFVGGSVKIIPKAAQSVLHRWRFQGKTLLGTALISFVAGSLFTARLASPREVRADNNRVFELMIYHTVPGQEPALEAIFRDVAKLQTKYNLNVVGYWVPNEDPAWKNTFIYLVVHPSREKAEANWRALHADPEFLPYRKSAAPLIEKANGDYQVDEIYMRPTEFSAMK